VGDKSWNFFERLLHGHDMPISETELQTLYSRIKSLPSAISGPFHKMETGIFPKDKCSRFLITPVHLTLTGKKHKPKQPLFPAAAMHGNLDLPALPESNIFCYYLRKRWVIDLLMKSLPEKKIMNPLMKAAALEFVEIV
jgi:hypothetical protein